MDTAAGGTVRYELEGSSQDSGSTFIMDAQNGHVTLNGPLDYESRTFYHYRVIARDQGTPSLSSTTDLFITVKDVQDSPPVFLNIPYFASVPENSAVGSSVLTVRADDQDRAIPNGVTYSITHCEDTAPLKGVDGRCTLGLKATEQNGSYPQKGNFTAVASASISVDDLNDNHPFFPHGYFTASMSENSPPGTPVQLDSGQQIIVTDIDQGPNSAIELSLVSGQDTYELTTSRIQSNGSVQLRVRDNAQLDYERVQSLVVKISASDGGPGHSAVTATVMVSVTNVNEYSPQFLQPRYTAMVPEGSAPGTYVTTVNATDRDIGDYGSITYTLTNARGIFTIDARSGAVAVNSSDTDREREDRYDLMVVATDGGGLQQAVPLTLRLSDVNDNPPVFLRRQYDVTLREDSLQFSRPVTLQATDADQKGTENANVTYAIRSTLPAGLQSHFRLAPFTGQLTVFQKLDYDTIQFPPAGSEGVVEVVVAATDNGQPAKQSASATVMITLIDVNDNDPVLHNAPFTTTIAERTSAGSFVFNVSASDADGSAPNNLITYAIESGGQDRFRINPDTGTVSVSGDLDREQLSSYTLVIVARDRASAPRSASSRMTIRIADVNDELPSFGTKENARISVNEGTRGVLYDMSAADPDLNSALQYRIVYRDSSAQPGGLRVEDWMEINANTGEVMAKETLDRTAVQMFVLRVQVTDTNGSVNTPQTTNATLTVTVVDINNHSPRFIPQGTVSASIRENMGKGTALTFMAPLRVSDLDEGDNSKFSVSVTGSSSPYFEVLPATVLSSADLLIRVKNNSVLDYEARTSLNITLLARETETAEHRTGTVTISLSLEDENDHSPHFVNETYHAAIPEALPAGTSVTTVTATDDDRSTEFSTITYSLQGAENLFTINPSTGEVTLLTNSTDYDTLPNTYQLTVLASDNEGRRGNALLTVSLTDINDLSPHFDRSEYTAALREGSTQFESPPLVKAVDGDEPGTPNSNITYTILRSDPAGLKSRFILGNRYSGAIDVVSSLDLESLPPSGLVSLTLQATDGGGRSSTSSVVITVLDVNDHTPQFSSGPSSPSAVSVLENATVGTLVHTFTATDGDRTSPNNNVTFLISSGANDQFSLDADGHLTVSRHLDRETVASYSLVVLALDKGVPQNTGTTTLSLLISDVNDVSPHFLRSSVSVPVEENTAGVVYTMSATDDDVDHRLSYGIVSAEGFHSGSLLPSRFTIPFAINPSTGAISINGQLDRETLDSAVLVIRVQDLASQNGPQTATGTVSISVGDRDDNAPRFTQSSLRVSVDENAAKGVPLTMPQLSVTDSDQGVNAEFRLSVTEHMRGTIDVVPSTATGSTVLVLRVGANNDMLDYEANPSIHFQIWAEGTVNPNRSSHCNVTLDINNLNDFLPQFQRQEYTASINESTATGTSVTTVKATDGDSGDLGNVSYSILGDNALFSVENASGLITTIAAPEHYNFEKTPEYYLTVMATDGGGATTTTRVHVSLEDINDQKPVFRQSEYSAFLKENSPTFDRGVTVKATDNDKENTPNSEVLYSLPGSSSFTVNATSGEVGIRSPVDYESVSGGVVRLTVYATDRGSPPLSSSVEVVVTVQDENDFPPVFEHTTYVRNVTEGTPTDTHVVTVNATDGDGSAPNNEVFYLLASGGNDKFRMDSGSGRLSTIGDIDRETRASYTLIIQAVDKGSPPKTATTTVIVQVDNINDDVPRFLPREVSVTVPEGEAPGTVVRAFSAVDNDEDAALSYQVLWNRSSGYDEDLNSVSEDVLKDAFSIDQTTGIIRINQGLDRETIETATLIIHVQDLHAPVLSTIIQTATGTVNIQVRDIDDHAPSFTSQQYFASIPETSPEGVPIHLPVPIRVSDPDKGTNSEFRLSLSTDCLRISPSSARGEATVVISVARLTCFDYETQESTDFRVIAEGEGERNFTTNASVHLYINNTNDGTPRFSQSMYSKSILENLNVSTSVLTVEATDSDKPPYNAFYYTLQGGDNVFSINNETGVVSVAKAKLDYETRNEYQLTVEATDIGGLRASVPLTITLTDLNDNPPQFARLEYQAFVVEGDSVFRRGVQVEANDRDGTEQNRGVQYRLSANSRWSSNFSVNASTGVLSLISPLDYEALNVSDKGAITLLVLAVDQGTPSLTGSVNVTVTVQDVNDEAPVFSLLKYQGNVTENQGPGVSVTQVQATDGDKSAPNNQVFYVIAGGGNDQFQINSTSGMVSTVASLDRERYPDYNLTILAMDRGSPAFTASTTVSVVVDNINDDPPRFVMPQLTVSFPETSTGSVTIANCSATDGDADADLRYAVLWNASTGLDDRQRTVSSQVLQDNFGLTDYRLITNPNNGLDREKVESATLYIQVIDQNAANGTHQTATSTVTIQVEDIDDNPPLFSGERFSANLTENSPRGTPLQFSLPINVTDVDKDDNSAFTLSLSDYSHCLEVLPSGARSEATVLIRVMDPTCFNYESHTNADFEVIATGTGKGHYRTNTTVHLAILNINDVTPNFTAPNYVVSVTENLNVSDNIITVQATDSDKPPYNEFAYSLQGGDNVFSIDNETGVVSVAKAQLDYETRNEYQLTVEATDIGGLRASVPLTITLTDLNDNPPLFARTEYQAFVVEGETGFRRDVQVQANDRDGTEQNRGVQYRLSANSRWSSNFSVNASTGVLSLISPLDYEALNVSDKGAITLLVLAVDQGTPSLTGSVNVTVTVQDVNDEAPVFLHLKYQGNVTENQGPGVSVTQVQATDGDKSAPNNQVFYVIAGGGNDQFQINSTSGLVSTVASLDRERYPDYNLTVLAMDRGSPAFTASTTVSVVVDNINDDPPRFVMPQLTVSFPETSTGSVTIANCSATDGDADADLRYAVLWNASTGLDDRQRTVSSQVLQDNFDLTDYRLITNPNNGLDREKVESATLYIQVIDQNAANGTHQTATSTVTIQVEDIDDNPPLFSGERFCANLTENSPRGTPLQFSLPINVTDVDKDDNSAFTLSLSDYSHCLEVLPSGARSEATVLIRVMDPTCFNYESHTNADFEVIATGTGKGHYRTNTTVHLTILNINDVTPNFNAPNYVVSVTENLNVSDNIITVQATDLDKPPYNEFAYSLQGGDNVFSIDNETGVVSVAKAKLDYETRNEYQLTVEATDIGGLRASVPLTITLTDLNDNPPLFARTEYQAFVVEGETGFRRDVQVQANDRDGTEQNRGVQYRLSANSRWSSNFSVNASTGVLSLISPLDYEALNVSDKGAITLLVLAVDQGTPSLTGSVNVTVTVQDVNDEAPVFLHLKYQGNVTENQGPGVSVTQVQATDGDKSAPNNQVFYVIAGGGNDQFQINSTSGLVSTVASLDRERYPDYNLTVLAMDRGSPAFTASTTVSVVVDNINDDPPRFVMPQLTVSFPETSTGSVTIANCSATDGDADADLKYAVLWNASTGLDDRQQTVSSQVLQDNFDFVDHRLTTNPTNGLDREKVESVTLYIQVIDQNAANGTHQTATSTVTIQVEDIDDNPPLFSGERFSANLTENSPRGTPLQFSLPIIVTDVDKDDNSAFTLSLSDYSQCLEVLPSGARSEATVLIRVTSPTCFNYENHTNADFEVIATGIGRGNYQTNTTVHLSIININDVTPNFTAPHYAVSVPENLNVSDNITTVQAIDSDSPPYNTVTYSLQGGDDMFTIDNVTGVVSVAKAQLDYETRQEYRMTVEATDNGGLRASVPLTITLTDLNDNPPQFARLEYQAFVDENRFDFDRPINITATDSDTGLNGEIRYTISPTSQLADNFTIDNSTGSLGIREASSGLDYEALPDTRTGIVHLTVVACDLGTPSLCSNVSVFVTVRDENDNEPIFGQSYDGNISENAVLGTPLLTVSARDSDGSAPNNKVFYVISGSGSDKFKVDSSSGNITRAGQLDSDTTAFYNLTVSAIDGGSPAKSSSTFVTVHVLDVNDVPPEFKPKSESVDVVESNGLQPGASERVVANMWATDPDQDKELSYHVLWSECRGFGVNQETLEVSSLQNVFEVDSSSGEVKVLNNSLDREKLSRAVLVVSVTDLHAVGPPQVSTGSLTINVKDVNDHKPQFNQPSYTAQIAENAVKDSILHIVSTDQMNVTDLDTDQDHCVFRITVDGPESAYFTAEPSTARSFALVQLRVRNGSVLDYEQRHNITFNVTVTETSTNESFSDTVVVTVSITDVNDNTPWFGQNYSVSIKENSPAHTNITRIQAFDEDSGSFGKITYSLEGDAARFSIDPTTGDIETADGRLDRETRDTYLMTVVATDGGGRRAGTPLTITVTDDNDQVPRFQGNYSTKVLENTVSLIPPVVLQAKDEDLANTPNSNVTYHLHTCVPVACGNFTLDEVSGQLTLNTELDFERTTGVELVVLAHDQGTVQLTGTATVIIDVQDVNDVDPTFTQNSYSVDIYENSEEGTVVGRVSANDGDRTSPNNVVFYVLDSGRGSDRFRVNSTTGIVTVGPGALLDREADDSFSLQLLALDRGDPPRSSTTTLSVSLLDVNDEKPFFGQERRAVHLREDVAVGHVVEVMNATDHDEDSSLLYSWELDESRATTDRDVRVNISRVSTWFSVNASTGLVTVSSELDRELAEIIVMKIMVNDTNGIKKLPQTALASLTITLTDVNDNRPVIKGSTSLRVSEALAEGTEVASYSARDADRDQSVTFSILSEGEAYFNISSAGKLSLQHQIDREKTPSVNFTVIATDSGSPPLTSNITIKVTVLDANDNDPQFQNTSYVFSVSENAPENTLVVVINATDRDEGANANVTFDFADNVYDFVMNKTTGEILVHKPLDRETRASYSFGIAALDNPVTDVKRRTIQQVTITVGDVNDNAPTFTSLGLGYDGYTAQIDETKEAGDKVLNVQPGPVRASDDDEGSNSALSFSLASKDGVDYFRMDPVTGELVVNGSIHGEAGVYNYTVTVTDGGQPPLNTSANLTIEVMDQNLNDPRFEGDYAHIPPIPECSPTETHIVTFTATDDDRNKETNGKVQYFFDNATSNLRDLPYFNLNPDTGLLTSARIFNREQQAHFQIGVIAQDKGVPNIRYSKPLRIRIDIDDGNDNPPKFNVTEYHFVVPEGQEGVRVGQVYAQDLDDFKRTCYTLDGKHKDYFNISTHTDRPADLQLVQALDRENAQQASFSLTVTAIDCTLSTGACDHQDFPPVFANVHITVSDVNDNPPNFTRPHLTFGLTSTANAGHIIANLQEYVADPDLGANRVHAFYPVGYYETDRKLNSSLKSAGSARLLALSVNGSLSTRSALPGDAEGFFTWTIMANDSAGEDTVVVKVYVVGKDKLIKITFFASVEELRQVQDDIVRDMSEQTGLQFVADDREPFEDSSGIDSSKSILVVHAVDKNENAMDANALMDFMDHEVTATDMLKTRYKLYDIQTYKAAESKGMDDRTKMEYILGAIICVLVVAFLITLYLMLSSIRRFKRKLKAARIETYPMTKQHLQHSVPGLKTPQTNPIFGKDEDLATKEVDVDRASTLSDESLDNNSVDINVIKVRSVDSASEDEQEVTLDLYGEDTEQPPSKARGDRSFYLDQALDEHQGRTTPNSLSNGHDPKRNGVTLGLNNGHAHLSQTVDFDLEGCESSDI
ncbi:cadherin-23-like [Babylonia areolata]|uniref:cadherin-23-like n=1 Tax=Babylonia areolata TaxID=304850 RepID=UPI003FD58D57